MFSILQTSLALPTADDTEASFSRNCTFKKVFVANYKNFFRKHSINICGSLIE